MSPTHQEGWKVKSMDLNLYHQMDYVREIHAVRT
jgi:hypothetical protein